MTKEHDDQGERYTLRRNPPTTVPRGMQPARLQYVPKPQAAGTRIMPPPPSQDIITRDGRHSMPPSQLRIVFDEAERDAVEELAQKRGDYECIVATVEKVATSQYAPLSGYSFTARARQHELADAAEKKAIHGTLYLQDLEYTKLYSRQLQEEEVSTAEMLHLMEEGRTKGLPLTYLTRWLAERDAKLLELYRAKLTDAGIEVPANALQAEVERLRNEGISRDLQD